MLEHEQQKHKLQLTSGLNNLHDNVLDQIQVEITEISTSLPYIDQIFAEKIERRLNKIPKFIISRKSNT